MERKTITIQFRIVYYSFFFFTEIIKVPKYSDVIYQIEH